MELSIKQADARGLPANIPELTSVRFFAAMFVVLFHVHDHLPALRDAPTQFFLKGYLGVDIFFILSGFILTHVYLAGYRAGTFSYGSFMLNRIARVYPLHLAMTLAFVALYVLSSRSGLLASGAGMDWRALPFHLAGVHAWGFVGNHAWNFPSWSISAEFFAYLIFPLFLVLTRVGASAGLLLSIAALSIAYFVVGLVFRPFTALTFDFAIIRIFFEFGLGVFLYLVCSRTHVHATVARWLLAGATVAFALMAHFGAEDLLLILLSGAIIFLLGQASKSAALSVMKVRPLVYLGEISYSTYMIHYFVELIYVGAAARLLSVEGVLPPLPWLGMIAAIMFGSVLSFHLIEVPARNFIRRSVSKRRLREPTAAS